MLLLLNSSDWCRGLLLLYSSDCSRGFVLLFIVVIGVDDFCCCCYMYSSDCSSDCVCSVGMIWK